MDMQTLSITILGFSIREFPELISVSSPGTECRAKSKNNRICRCRELFSMKRQEPGGCCLLLSWRCADCPFIATECSQARCYARIWPFIILMVPQLIAADWGCLVCLFSLWVRRFRTNHNRNSQLESVISQSNHNMQAKHNKSILQVFLLSLHQTAWLQRKKWHLKNIKHIKTYLILVSGMPTWKNCSRRFLF